MSRYGSLFLLVALAAPAYAVDLEAADGGIFRAVEPGRAASAVDVDNRGVVWIAGSNGVYALADSDPGRPTPYPFPGGIGGTVLTGLRAFPGQDVWVGFYDGGVARLHRGRWEKMSAKGAPRRQTVTDFAKVLGDLYTAEIAVRRWDDDAARWRDFDHAGNSFHRLAATSPNELYLGGASGVARCRWLEGVTCERLWSPSGHDEWVISLEVDAAGRILAGTRDGLMILATDGKVVARELRGHRVSAIVPLLGGELWVGTADAGLHHFDGKEWRRLGYREGFVTDTVSDLALDQAGRLWVVANGVWVAGLDRARAGLRALPAPAATPGRVFTDACAAAAELLGESRTSGQVAYGEVAGSTYVWLDGEQVCPGRTGPPWVKEVASTVRRRDGVLVLLAFNGARFSSDCNPKPCPPEQAPMMVERWRAEILRPTATGFARSEVPPPHPIPGETPTRAVLLDSRGRLWLSTQNEGVFVHDPESGWSNHRQPWFPPRSTPWTFVEDRAGAVWVGASPSFDPARGKYPSANVFRFRDGEVRSWSPDDGIGYWSTNAVLPLANGEVAVGTNGGLSIIAESGVRTYKHEELRGHAHVASIAEDASGWLWLTHNGDGSGLTWYDGFRFYNMSSRDGLFADRLRQVAIDGADRVWLLDDRGRVGVYPRATFASRVAREAEVKVEKE